MKRVTTFGLFLLTLAIVVLALVTIRSKPAVAPTPSENIVQEEQAPQKKSLEGNYLFSGTVVWARRYEQWSTRADGSIDYAYPFRGLQSFEESSKYDAWLADFECASGAQIITQKQAEQQLIFNCRPEFLAEAAKYFTHFNLANNHTLDLGVSGLAETRQNVLANGIQPIGDFDPSNKDTICEIVALPIRIQLTDETESLASIPVAFCAWHYFFRLPQAGELEVMEEYAKHMPVFAFVQAGAEYRASADIYQKQIARRLADLGASFVVGNSPHWVQDGEAWNGVPILYSTGNFIFDQDYNQELLRSVSLDVTMTLTYSPDLEPWLALAPSCEMPADTCLEQIVSGGYTKLEPEFTFDIVAGDGSNKLVKRASSEVQAAVEERVGWRAMQASLGQVAD